jgi:hypothetical protein
MWVHEEMTRIRLSHTHKDEKISMEVWNPIISPRTDFLQPRVAHHGCCDHGWLRAQPPRPARAAPSQSGVAASTLSSTATSAALMLGQRGRSSPPHAVPDVMHVHGRSCSVSMRGGRPRPPNAKGPQLLCTYKYQVYILKLKACKVVTKSNC